MSASAWESARGLEHGFDTKLMRHSETKKTKKIEKENQTLDSGI